MNHKITPHPTSFYRSNVAVRSQAGIVLFVILVVILLTSMLALSLLYLMKAEATAEAAVEARAQAWNTILSGVARAMTVAQEAIAYQQDSWRKNPMSLQHQLMDQIGGENWYFTVYVPDPNEDSGIRFGLSDEASRLPLYTANTNQLMQVTGMDAESAARLIEAVHAMVGSPPPPETTGAENDETASSESTNSSNSSGQPFASPAPGSGPDRSLSPFDFPPDAEDEMTLLSPPSSPENAFPSPFDREESNSGIYGPEESSSPSDSTQAPSSEETSGVPHARYIPLICLWARAGLPEEWLESPTRPITAENLDLSSEGTASSFSIPSSQTASFPFETSNSTRSCTNLANLLTPYTYEPNVASDGSPRINLNDPNLDLDSLDLPAQTREFLRLMREAGKTLHDPADLLEAEETFTDKKGRERTVRSGIGKEELPDLLDRYTTTDAPYLIGRININTAPIPVLMTLTNMTEALAEQIVQTRASLLPDERRTPAWLYTRGIVDANLFRLWAPHLTARSYQFRFRIVAYSLPNQRFAVAEAVIDLASGQPRLLALRDLTRLGFPFPLQVLTGQSGSELAASHF